MAAIANRVVIGELNNPLFTFENPKIKEIYSDTAVSLIGDELYIDQFSPTLEYEVRLPYIFAPKKTSSTWTTGMKVSGGSNPLFVTASNYDLRKLPYGTKVTFYSNNQIVGEFFSKKVERIGKTTYKLNAMSAIGLMNHQYHTGGIYTGQLFPSVLAEILGDGYEYEIDSSTSLSKQRIFGWLPYSTRRRNLHQLMVAYGVNLVKNANGKMKFTFLTDSTPTQIADSRVFSGGSVTYDDPASRVEVTEHTFRYDPRMEEETVFDNTQDDAVSHALVTFDKPIYPDSVRCTDGSITIHSVGVNHAYVSGNGILVGKPYLHTTKVISADNDSAASEKVVKIEEATLVTLMTSENVLERMKQYYFHATTVSQDIINDGEKAGARYITSNAFGETVTGFISHMSTNVTSFRRSSCEFIQGYVPPDPGANYEHRDIVPLNTNASSSWSISGHGSPTRVRVVLIGFGEDGTAGTAGEAGTGGDDRAKGLGGAGGIGGKGGKGGKILSFTLGTAGLTSLNFSNSGKNSRMTTTPNPTSTTYSSADGASLYAGFYDPYDGTVYGLPGADGIDGGRGGDGEVWKHTNGWESEVRATPGDDVIYKGVTYSGGAISTATYEGSIVHRDQFSYSTTSSYPDHPEFNNIGTVFISANGGGGAAAGSAGSAGRLDPEHYYSNGQYAGTGGKGANAVAPDATPTLYGNGGNGGHGGGGGGGSSCREWVNLWKSYPPDADEVWDLYDSSPTLGQGGTGSAGTAGYRGCALIYY